MNIRYRNTSETRREDLINAARQVFAHKGVENSTVSDIVKAARVAQGTFYLYFENKNEMIAAIADKITEEMVEQMEFCTADHSDSAVDRLKAFHKAILEVADNPANMELSEIYHRPENRPIHDRMAERLMPRLVPILESIVTSGIAEGYFYTDNPKVSISFILGGLHMMEHTYSNKVELTEALKSSIECSLRILGYRKPGDGS